MIFGEVTLLSDSLITINGTNYKIIDDVICLTSLNEEIIKNKFDTVSSFGNEWTEFNDIKKSHYTEFEQYFDQININKLIGKLIADFGCGNGRWSYILNEKCNVSNIILTDYSDAIFVARENFRNSDKGIFIKADLENLNLRSKVIDFSYCIGVLHHLPNNLSDQEISIRNISHASKEALFYLYHNLEERKFWFQTLYYLSNFIRKFLYPIKSFKIKNILSYLITSLFYMPAVFFNRFSYYLFIPISKFPLSFYTFMNFERIRQDAYDKFFTPTEYRYSKSQIENIFKKYYRHIIYSENIPKWHFCAFNEYSDLLIRKKQKILLITQGFKGGGAQKIMNELVDLNDDVTNLKLLYVDRDQKTGNENIIFSKNQSALRSIYHINDTINKYQPDIVLTTLINIDLLIIFLNFIRKKKFKHIIRLSVVLSEHYKFFKFNFAINLLLKISFRFVKEFICMSDDMVKDLNTRYLKKKANIHKIPNFINTEHFLNGDIKKNECKQFICVGRVHFQKGYDILIDSIKYTKKDFKIRIYGWGDSKLEKLLRNKIVDENLTEYVEFMGRCNSVYDILNGVDALIMPSRYEGFPNVGLEALSVGVPILALPFKGGINELINQDLNGKIANSFSPMSLAKIINDFEVDKYDRVKIIGSIKKYDKKLVLEKYKSVFKNVF